MSCKFCTKCDVLAPNGILTHQDSWIGSYCCVADKALGLFTCHDGCIDWFGMKNACVLRFRPAIKILKWSKSNVESPTGGVSHSPCVNCFWSLNVIIYLIQTIL